MVARNWFAVDVYKRQQQIDPRILDGTVSEAEIMRMAEAGNMGDMGIMMLYGTVMLGLCIACLLYTSRCV